MKISTTLFMLTGVASLMLCGCASDEAYRDEQEYSDMPWNTPAQWEGSRSLPGLSGQQPY